MVLKNLYEKASDIYSSITRLIDYGYIFILLTICVIQSILRVAHFFNEEETMNASKKKDPRFWQRRRESGAVANKWKGVPDIYRDALQPLEFVTPEEQRRLIGERLRFYRPPLAIGMTAPLPGDWR